MQFVSNTSTNMDAVLIASAYICIPYVSFLRRIGKIKKAIQLITDIIDRLNPFLALDIDIYKELYDSRGILYWADRNYSAALQDFDAEENLLNFKAERTPENYLQDEINIMSVSVFANRALVYISMGHFQEAEKMTLRAIDLSRKANAFSLLMPQLGDMGWNKFARGQFDQAIEYYNEQLQMAAIANDQEKEHLAIYNRASVRMYAGQSSEAYKDLLYIMENFKKSRNTSIFIGVLIDLCCCYLILGKMEIAKKYYQKAYRIAARQKSSAFELEILRCGALFQPVVEAESNLEKAVTLARKLNRKFDETACLLHLAYLSGDPDTKQSIWIKAKANLEYMGALSWIENKTPQELVLLPFISA